MGHRVEARIVCSISQHIPVPSAAYFQAFLPFSLQKTRKLGTDPSTEIWDMSYRDMADLQNPFQLRIRFHPPYFPHT